MNILDDAQNHMEACDLVERMMDRLRNGDSQERLSVMEIMNEAFLGHTGRLLFKPEDMDRICVYGLSAEDDIP